MNMNLSTKSIRILTNGGKHKYFQAWWMQYIAYTAVYGFSVSIIKVRYPYFLSGEDTVINLATTESNKQ